MPAPPWFTQALAQEPEHRDVVVAGARVAHRVWGPVGAPGVVLVHGGAAHSGWWDHVAPLLTGHRVVALDLTGHGSSDRRDSYDPHLWAREVVAVAAAAELDRPVVVGHSMGGWVAVTVAAEHAGDVSSVVVVDSPLNDQPPDEERLRERRRPHRVYPTAEEAVARFRTLPPQDVVLPFVRDHVARGSLRAVEGGWSWAFDPDFFGARLRLRDLLPGAGAPLTLLRCEHGLVSAAMAEEMAGLVRGGMPVVELPDAGHHPMLDQPLALVAALRTLLALRAPRR
ncbi:Alpha/beta hydrolase [Modestobacter italicus]|uniref:Alpha/beta hydrolase n=1 Tax=Modestobacter italicus (strain DSM 44449 / CECT 9708 / BC 501) TaxID=2732864 RepID=I4EVZ2_MODI5|nr:alpha/beta hydrolase [Modestobacter marinus]CCH87555.1 Alpha/beta hydrolase [Modestobacter marinus]